jgi:type III pantothenate kinase
MVPDSLLIECGNSRCKWARSGPGGIEYLGAAAYAELASADALAAAWQSSGSFERVMIATVSANPVLEAALALLQPQLKAPIRHLIPVQASHGLHLAYEQADKLGVDRWLAMLAAVAGGDGPVCVVDCGTAMTVDVVAAGGEHLGGQIIPGLELMRASLHHGTSLLPKVGGPVSSGLLGKDTESCIAAGTLAALAGAVNMVLEELAYLGAIRGIITGGNAHDVLPLLHGQWQLRPHLVLEGMAVIGKIENIGDGL